MRIVTHGATDQSIELFIVDSDGLPATGLAYNSSGIDLWYRRNGAAVTSITEATQTANGAHSDGGFVGLGNGVYRLDPPDAAFASGVSHVTFGGTITGYTVYPVTVQLTAFDLQTATQAVNVTQFGGSNGTFASGRPEVNTTHWGGTAVASATPNVNVAQISGDSTAADNAESFFDGTGYAGTNNVIPTVTTTTNLTNKGDGSGFTAIPWNASWDAEVQSEVDDALIAKGLDHLVFTSVTGTDIADNSIIAKMASKSATADWDSFANTTDSLEAIRDNGGGGVSWADLVADNDDVAGSFGKAIADILVDTGTSIPDAIDDLDAGLAEPDDRDLEPVQHVWQLKRSGDGTLRSTNPLYISTGTAQTIRAGWNCDLPSILPPGTVISTESIPELVTASDDVTITDIGHGEKVAKVELGIEADAAAGSHWVKTTITNTNGGGPIAVYGEVIVQAEPE